MLLKIRSGDIMLFEMEKKGDFLGKCITLLTDSNITHSAMIYKDNTIIEMIDSGISVTPFHQSKDGRKVHLLRFTPEVKFEPLLEAADFYLSKHINYNFASLILLAGLLIFKKINFTAQLSDIIFEILSSACLVLDEIYQSCTDQSDNNSMMCSQLVYQCYYDCGSNYRIKIRDGLLQNDSSGFIKLYDYINSYTQTVDIKWEQKRDEIKNFNIESLAKNLYQVLSEPKYNIPDKFIQNRKFDFTMLKVIEFLKKLEKILKSMKMDIDLPALFVTPADLLNHSENLKHYSTISIVIDK